MFGELSHELDVAVPASETWDFFRGLRFGMLVREMKDLFQDVEVVHGDGGVGTIILLTFVPGIPGVTSYKEKFTKIDDEIRVKETEVVEGGYLDFGFNLYRIRIHVVEKEEATCTVRCKIEYDVKDEFAANASAVSIDPLVKVVEYAKDHLVKSYKEKSQA